MFKFGCPKRPAIRKKPAVQTVPSSPVRTARTKKKTSLPMTGEHTLKRETRPLWIKWTVRNGSAHREFRPGFFHETAPCGFAAEGSLEEFQMKVSVLKVADQMSKS